MDLPPLTRVRYNCKVNSLSNAVSSDPNNVPMDPPVGHPYFNIKASKSEWNWQLLAPGRVGLSNEDFAVHDFFNIPKNSMEEIANLIPSHFGVPQFLGSSMAAKILDFAKNMVDNTHKGDKILFMEVAIEVVRTSYYRSIPSANDQYRQAVRESLDNQSLRMIPASKSFIEGLQTVKLEEEEELSNCVICLKGFKVGIEEITRMPCSHLFHKPCIINWLHQNNTCPLCRFQVSTDQSDN